MSNSFPPRRADVFLAGGGEMGDVIRGHDWEATSLGAPGTWPHALRTAVRLILNTGHPMYIFWGPELLCFYNDAYRTSIGPERHPGSLGQPAREVWAEIWEIIGPQIDQVMTGQGATWHENQLVPITRNGRREEIYWTYSYGPIHDETAEKDVGGVLVVCTETTAAVLAERRLAADVARQRRLFEQAPSFVIIMRGAEHVVEFVNQAHLHAFASADWVGKPIREAFPDIARQGFFELIDGVYQTGEVYRAQGAEVRYHFPPTDRQETRYLDFIYAPLLGEDGCVTGVFCEGYDVTERIAAEQFQATLNRELGHRMKNQLAMVQAIVGQSLRSSRGAEALGRTIVDRIQVLARAHEALIAGEIELLPLREIVQRTISLHDDRLDPRYAFDGPDLALASRAALSMALILHELATNAAKHGALSSEDGEVRVSWRTERTGGTTEFVFQWTETGGPPVSPPSSLGSGHRLINAGLAGSRGGSVALVYAPDGVRCAIRAELSSVQEEH
jgi:two-component sensor histidine kinase